MGNLSIIVGFLFDLLCVWGPWLVLVGAVWFVAFCALYKRRIG